jgi:hypothetical protein
VIADARVTLTIPCSFSWRGFSSSGSYAVPGLVKLSTVLWASVASAAQAEGRQQSPSSAPLNLSVAGFKLQMEHLEGMLGVPLRVWKVTDSPGMMSFQFFRSCANCASRSVIVVTDPIASK